MQSSPDFPKIPGIAKRGVGGWYCVQRPTFVVKMLRVAFMRFCRQIHLCASKPILAPPWFWEIPLAPPFPLFSFPCQRHTACPLFSLIALVIFFFETINVNDISRDWYRTPLSNQPRSQTRGGPNESSSNGSGLNKQIILLEKNHSHLLLPSSTATTLTYSASTRSWNGENQANCSQVNWRQSSQEAGFHIYLDPILLLSL